MATSIIGSKNPEWDCLLIACQKGDDSSAKQILRENPLSKFHANKMGQSALHIAAWWCRVECVDALLQAGADPHSVNSFTGATPLHECLESNVVNRSKGFRQRRIKCISLLIRAKADTRVLDQLGRTPLDCFALVDDDDIADHAEIEELILANEKVAQNPLRSLIPRFKSKEISLKEVDQLWVEKVLPDMDILTSFNLLSSALLTTTESWIDRAEKMNENCAQTTTSKQEDIDDLCFATWLWNKLVEISPGKITEDNDDDEGTIISRLDSIRKALFCKVVTALFNRYENQYRIKKSSTEGTSLIKDDPTLSSWAALAVLLVEEVGPKCKTDESSSSTSWDDRYITDQAWITIARRDYFELAELWLDSFRISPIGIANRQGMSCLQFAARSGHFRMVKLLTSHPSTIEDEKSLKCWINNQDQQGHTALAAAKANRHEQIAELLQAFINSR